jgi:hypothetical protein
MAAPTNTAHVKRTLANSEPFSNRIFTDKSSLLVLITRPGVMVLSAVGGSRRIIRSKDVIGPVSVPILAPAPA